MQHRHSFASPSRMNCLACDMEGFKKLGVSKVSPMGKLKELEVQIQDFHVILRYPQKIEPTETCVMQRLMCFFLWCVCLMKVLLPLVLTANHVYKSSSHSLGWSQGCDRLAAEGASLRE